jgi:Uncharacterized protein containing SIS (Sugar ISomerase) phosphosugar binding domain
VSTAIPETPGHPYLDAIEDVLARAKASNLESLPAAAGLVADVVTRNGIVYVFGSGHSQLVALEVSRRAGSIVPLQVLYDPMWGRSECVEGFGQALLSDVAFTAADCLVVISNSGTTVAPIEVAMASRAAGTPVIVLTAIEPPRAARSRHSSGKRLGELGDVVIDNASLGSDLAIRVGSTGVGATSTLVASALLHEVIAEAVLVLAARGIEAPVYRANAEDGGSEHNARLRKPYLGRLTTVP